MTFSIIIRLVTLILVLIPLSTPAGAETREVLLAAYSVPKEVYEKRIIPAFVHHWKQRTGETIQSRSSFAASGAQARAIVEGLDADIAALSLESDLQQLVQAGLVTHDWKQGPQQGIITTSVVALGVRKGNPKSIHGREDLTRPGVEVLYPSPKTSGGAMWDIVAIYGAGLQLGTRKGVTEPASRDYAADLITRIQRHVKVMDKSGRESVTTFERGVGDVIVTYENELLPRIAQGCPYELVYPPETVVVENPIALVDRHADRHQVRDIAEAFIVFLHGAEAQQAFAEFGFRPTNPAIATSTAAAFVHPPHIFTIASLGGWDHVFPALFSPQGAWTRAVEKAGRDK